MRADCDNLEKTSLGKIIPPIGGQVKRAAMDALSSEGPPTFSRMSGIQEVRPLNKYEINGGLSIRIGLFDISNTDHEISCLRSGCAESILQKTTRYSGVIFIETGWSSLAYFPRYQMDD